MKWIEINLPYGPIYSRDSIYSRDLNELDSIESRGLNKPGVLIKTADGKEYLIGNINENRGVCDDCVEFSENEIVVAYKIVWEPSTTN